MLFSVECSRITRKKQENCSGMNTATVNDLKVNSGVFTSQVKGN